MNFNRNYGTGKYNECKKIQCTVSSADFIEQ